MVEKMVNLKKFRGTVITSSNQLFGEVVTPSTHSREISETARRDHVISFLAMRSIGGPVDSVISKMSTIRWQYANGMINMLFYGITQMLFTELT